MELKDYFENAKGWGVLATADSNGKVDAAIYARPHFLEDGSIAFIMADRLTHKNLTSNPHAAYLFMEKEEGYVGKRLYLTMTGEEHDQEKIVAFMKERSYSYKKDYERKVRFFVTFRIDKVLPLIGDKEEDEK